MNSKTTFASIALLASIAATTLQAAAPANDKFETARVLTSTAPELLSQTGAGSTADVFDPFIGGVKLTRSVWYRFDAQVTTAFARIIINDKSGVRAGVFRLYDPDGNAGTLQFLAQTNNVLPNDIETLNFSTIRGQRYYICVESAGLFDVAVRTPTQANDYFDSATSLVGDEGTVTGNNFGATNVGDTPATLPAVTPGKGVWYRWTPNFNGLAVVDTSFSERGPGNSFDTALAVFSGTTLANLVPLASDDDGGVTNNSRVVFNASAGTTYSIWVGAYSLSEGNFFLSYFQEGNPGVFEIANAPGDVSENQGNTTLHVRRFRAGNSQASVTFATSNGTATGGADFSIINTNLVFPNPVTDDTGWVQDVTLTVLPDLNVLENKENFGLVLSNASPGASIGASSPKNVFILNGISNDAPGFAVSQVIVKEGAGSIEIPLTRTTPGGVAAVQVSSYVNAQYYSARAGSDFTAVEATITFQPGQTEGSLTLTILDDGLFEKDEYIDLVAAPLTPNLTQAGYSNTRIIIEDDDLPRIESGRLTTTMDTGGIAGTVDIQISSSGSVTGKVVTTRGSLPFTGKLVNGRLDVALGSASAPKRSLAIKLINAENKTYQLTLNDGELGTTVSSVVTASNFSKINPCPVAGYYTIADSNGGGGIPQLFAATIKVDAAGSAVMSGKVFDGTAIATSGAVNSLNEAWIAASLYGGKGSIAVRALLTNSPQTFGSAIFSIIRPGRSNQTAELPSGELNNIACNVARYVPPTLGQRALSIWQPAGQGNAEISGGGFPLTIKAITVSTANKVSVAIPLPEKLTIALNTSTGVVTGSVLAPGNPTPRPVFGVLLQGGPVDSVGRGFFVNGINPGKVRLRGP